VALTTTRTLLTAAEEGGYAVGAFNVSDLNQAHAVMEAADDARSPVIVQAIAGMSAYRHESWWWNRLRDVVTSYPDVPVALHLDHGRTAEHCRAAIDHGFTSVMIDGSRDPATGEPSDFAVNVALTASVSTEAHAVGVSVEGELGTVGGAEAGGAAKLEDLVLADPDQAVEFVAATGVDALAVAVGTSHGSVKFTDAAGSEGLRIDLIAEIKARLPGTYLVLHGSSSIPVGAVQAINAHGGTVRPSSGITVEQKSRGIAAGIRKVNQGTDSHLEWTAAVREFSDRNPATVEPSAALAAGIRAVRAIVIMRMNEFGSAGRAR